MNKKKIGYWVVALAIGIATSVGIVSCGSSNSSSSNGNVTFYGAGS
jgi:hypothetical protein